MYKPEEYESDDAYLETWDKSLILSDLVKTYGDDAEIEGYGSDEIHITYFKKNPNYEAELDKWKEFRRAELIKELEELSNEN